MTDNNVLLANTIQSPFDPRDWIAESIFPKVSDLNLPKTLDLRKDLLFVRNQRSQGSCAAESASCIKEWQERKNVGLIEYMAPQFVYNLRSNYPDAGMYLRDVMNILHKKGCCREAIFPYGERLEGVTDEALADAQNYKIKSYALVNTIDGVKTALYKNGPCLIAFPCYNGTGKFWKPINPGDKAGGHAVVIVGYDKTGFIIRNSWGPKWNGNGHTIYPYSEFGAHWEIWTTIDDNSKQPDYKSRIKGYLFALFTHRKECM